MALHVRCHLCVRGGYHWDLHKTDTHSPLGCAPLFGDGISSSVLLNRGHAMCYPVEPLRQWSYEMKPLPLGLLVPFGKPHVRAYMTAVGGDPSKPQSPPSEGEGEPHLHLLATPSQSGQTPCQSPGRVWCNLTDHELCISSVEDLCKEITHCELNAPTRSPLPMPWENLLGNGKSQWGWPGGHLSERRRVGSPKPKDNHSQLTSSCVTTRWRMGSSGTTSSTLQLPA